MRILLITQWFDPEPHFKGLPFARELAKLGHEVEVLTGFPNYPGGKVYKGYRMPAVQRETMEGIPVLRVPLYPSHDTSGLRRILNYSSFAVSATAMGSALVKPADVAYVYHPPGTIGLPAMALKLLRRIPFVYDIQDLWPDTLKATGMFNYPAGLWVVDKWCRLVYSQASRIAVLSPGFKEILVQRGVPERKIEVIYNWCDEGQIQLEERDEALARELSMAGRFNVVFAGTMGKAQALDAVLDAARILADRIPAVQFVFVGGGVDVPRLKDRTKELGLQKNVLFLPRRPVSEIGKVLNLADVLLVHLKDDPLFSITVPSKTQAYLAVGKPIIMGVGGDAADLVRRAGAGVVCRPENPQSIVEAVQKLYAMPSAELESMGQNGRAFYQRELSIRVGARRFADLLEAARHT